jgi:hypothetical protein
MNAREPRRRCAVCFQQWAPPGAYKCDDCNPTTRADPRTKRARVTLNADLAEVRTEDSAP